MTDGNVRAEVSTYNTSIDVSFGTAYEVGEGLSSVVIADKYDSTKTYEQNDYVIYEKKLYRCTFPVEEPEAFDNDKWTLVKLANDVKALDDEIIRKADIDAVYTKTETDNKLDEKLNKNNPTGTGSLAVGDDVSASGTNSTALGKHAVASGSYSFASGYSVTASAADAHAEGYATTASALNAHAEGFNTEATGNNAHAEGSGTHAIGVNSHAEGSSSYATHKSQHVFGENNLQDGSSASSGARGNYVEIVGNGSDPLNRSNARTLDWSGNETLAGNLIFNGSTSLSAEILRLDNRINNLPKGVNPKGTLGTSGTIQDLPTASATNEGYMYEVIEEGTYGGQASRIGDVFIGYNPPGTSTYAWLYIPSGDDDAYTRAQADAKFATKNEIKDTTITGALYHLGFYLDENGGLCQVNSI